MSDEADTFDMTLAGRPITFRRAHVGQILMLQRGAMRAISQAQQEQGEDKRIAGVSTAMVRVLDFIDSQIVSPDDRQFVEDQMLAGTISWEDLTKALGGPQAVQAPDDEAPKPKRAPRKSPRAASAKAVANRGRTQR